MNHRNHFVYTLLAAAIILALTGCRGPKPVSPLPTPRPVASFLPTPTAPAVAAWPGGRLLYHSDSSGVYQIYLLVAGQPAVELTHGPGSAVEPAWSPDGQLIAFSAYTTNPDNSTIYVMRADGSDRHQVKPDQPELNWRPAWSPDGKQLVFQSNRDGNFEIYKINLDGTSELNLTGHPSNDGDPTWSPDGSKILFYSDRSKSSAMYTMDADGSNVTMVLDGSWRVSYPRWSPDGKRIVFASAKNSSQEIYVVNADGSQVQKVSDRLLDNTMPAWVGNDKVIFSGDDGGMNWDLYLVNADGTGQTQVTRDRNPKGVVANRYPAWLP
jgi:tol-pal system beta propeller repeat protein TolB